MMKKMKLKYIIGLIVVVAFFNSCAEKLWFSEAKKTEYVVQIPSKKVPDNVYGTYLAGRLAHMRQEYDTAAKYYIKSFNLGTSEEGIINSIYLLLASEGKIEEASEYAKKAFEKGDKSNLIHFILMSVQMKHQRYDEVYQEIMSIDDKPFKDSLSGIFRAWALAGLDQK